MNLKFSSIIQQTSLRGFLFVCFVLLLFVLFFIITLRIWLEGTLFLNNMVVHAHIISTIAAKKFRDHVETSLVYRSLSELDLGSTSTIVALQWKPLLRDYKDGCYPLPILLMSRDTFKQ